MPWAIDPSTPAEITDNSGGTPAAATTAAFSPPGNAVLAALVCSTFGGTATPSFFYQMTDNSSGQLTWTIRTVSPAPTSIHSAFAQVVTAKVPPGGLSGLTCTATQAGGAGYGLPLGLQILVVTGVQETGGATFGQDISSSNPASVSFTPNNNGSLPVLSMFSGGDATALVAAANNTFQSSTDTSPTNTAALAMGYYSGTVTGGTAVTAGSSSNISGFSGYIAVYELPLSAVIRGQRLPIPDSKSSLKKLAYLLG